MTVKVEYTCPLGSTCEEVKDGKIMRCAWYTKVMGKDPQSTEDIENWACAMSWMPTMMVEMSQTNRGQTAALESFRNETVKGQAEFNSLVKQKIAITN
jgi:hypothetical protein